MSNQRSNARADKRPWMETELLQWFDGSKPIRATDNRPAERREPRGEPVKAGVTPLEPPEFRSGR
jgi:hypothetical protein